MKNILKNTDITICKLTCRTPDAHHPPPGPDYPQSHNGDMTICLPESLPSRDPSIPNGKLWGKCHIG